MVLESADGSAHALPLELQVAPFQIERVDVGNLRALEKGTRKEHALIHSLSPSVMSTTSSAIVLEGTRHVGLVRRSIAHPATMYYYVRDVMLGFLVRSAEEIKRRTGGERELIDLRLVERLQAALDWAEKEKEPHVPFVCFWWLCCSLDAFMTMVREQETVGRSHPRPAAQMTKIEVCARAQIQELKGGSYEATNARQLIEGLHAVLNAAALQGRVDDVNRLTFEPGDLEEQFCRIVGRSPLGGGVGDEPRVDAERRHRRAMRTSVDNLLGEHERARVRFALDEAVRLRRARLRIEGKRKRDPTAAEEAEIPDFRRKDARSLHFDDEEALEEGEIRTTRRPGEGK